MNTACAYVLMTLHFAALPVPSDHDHSAPSLRFQSWRAKPLALEAAILLEVHSLGVHFICKLGFGDH